MLEIVFKFLFGHSWEFYDSSKKELKCRLSDMHSLAQLGDIENKLKIQT